MIVTPLEIVGVWLIEAPIYPDNRGLFREWFIDDLSENSEIPRFEVKQANTSISARGVIRGIHFSNSAFGQSKIVTCTSGSILDVVVDLRRGSDTFGKSITIDLNAQSGISIFISSGLGHGFQALEENTVVTYLLNRKYDPSTEFTINPLDKGLSINWRISSWIMSEKDKNGQPLSNLTEEDPANGK
jgi:dTDP-4-dehydrorhamnose 3,5-epimerase